MNYHRGSHCGATLTCTFHCMIAETARLTSLARSRFQEGTHVLRRGCSSVGSEVSELRRRALASWSHVSESAVKFCKYWENYRLYLTAATIRSCLWLLTQNRKQTGSQEEAIIWRRCYKLLCLFPQVSETVMHCLGFPQPRSGKHFWSKSQGSQRAHTFEFPSLFRHPSSQCYAAGFPMSAKSCFPVVDSRESGSVPVNLTRLKAKMLCLCFYSVFMPLVVFKFYVILVFF